MMIQKLFDSELRYRTLFENAPIPIEEEDYSGVKQYLAELENGGIVDLREYLSRNVQEIEYCLSLVKIVQANRRSLEIFHCTRSEDIILEKHFIPYLRLECFPNIVEMLLLFHQEIAPQGVEISILTSDHQIRYYLLYYAIDDANLKSLAHVYTSFIDVTLEKKQQETLPQDSMK